ncbi:hypothetical protein LINPERHAP1_LOCUS36276, partial [Linum perenne]
SFPRDLVWVSLVPTKVCGFHWLAFHRNISTFKNLARRGFIGPSICVLCRADLKSVSHLFRSCRYTLVVWDAFSSKLAIHGPFEQEVDDFIIGWQDRNCLSQFQPFRKCLIHAVFWYICGERNNRIFRGDEVSSHRLVSKIVFAVGRWLRAAGKISSDEFGAWLRTWRQVSFDVG